MDAEEFKRNRKRLGLTLAELGHILNTDPRTIRKWEAGDNATTARAPNPIAAQALRWMLAGFRPPQWPARLADDARGHQTKSSAE